MMNFRSVMLVPPYIVIWALWRRLPATHPWRAKYGARIFPWAVWIKSADRESVHIGFAFTATIAMLLDIVWITLERL